MDRETKIRKFFGLKECPHCGKEISPLDVGEYLFHVKSTHGFDGDVYALILNQWISR